MYTDKIDAAAEVAALNDNFRKLDQNKIERTLRVDATGNNQIGKNNLIEAWVVFTSTGTVAVFDGYNVTSVTDLGAGNFRLNFTNELDSANYALMGSAQFSVSSRFVEMSNTDPTTTTCNIFVTDVGGTSGDSPRISAVIVR